MNKEILEFDKKQFEKALAEFEDFFEYSTLNAELTFYEECPECEEDVRFDIKLRDIFDLEGINFNEKTLIELLDTYKKFKMSLEKELNI